VKGFRNFITRGNVIDLATAVVVGAAFTAIVTAFVKDIITPLIGAIWGTHNFEALDFKVHGSTFDIGDFINAVIYFLMVAAVVYYVIVKPVGALMARRQQVAEITTRDCPECLSSIPIAASRCMYCTAEVPPVTPVQTAPAS
jgi:large conductance mechanosensitive channel